MRTRSFDLAWITVNDLKKAVDFYVNVLGLKVMEISEEYGWAELKGREGGARIGIAQKQPSSEPFAQPGQNAIMAITVENLDQSVKTLIEKGAKLVGKAEEIPGHVRIQTLVDLDGNHLQFVQVLHPVHKGCCSGH